MSSSVNGAYNSVTTPYTITTPNTPLFTRCEDGTLAVVLTGSQNVYYMIGWFSPQQTQNIQNNGGDKGCWYNGDNYDGWTNNNWLSVDATYNSWNVPVFLAPFIPGGCNAQKNDKNQMSSGNGHPVGIPIWFDDGGVGNTPVNISYVDSGNPVLFGYRICTYGYKGVSGSSPAKKASSPWTSPNPPSPINDKTHLNKMSSNDQSDYNNFCTMCEPSNEVVMYLGLVDDGNNVGWIRTFCNGPNNTFNEAELSNGHSTEGMNAFGYDNLFYFFDKSSMGWPAFSAMTLGSKYYLGFAMPVQVNTDYIHTPNGNSTGYGYQTTTYSPSLVSFADGNLGGSSSYIKSWNIYMRLIAADCSSRECVMFSVVPTMDNPSGSTPSTSSWCRSGQSEPFCGNNPPPDKSSCVNSPFCIRNNAGAFWYCSPVGGGSGKKCTGTCKNIPGVCDSSGDCVKNAVFYKPVCKNGTWTCVMDHTSVAVMIIVGFVVILFLIWFFFL